MDLLKTLVLLGLIVSLSAHELDSTLVTYQTNQVVKQQLQHELNDIFEREWRQRINETFVSEASSTWYNIPTHISLTNFKASSIETDFSSEMSLNVKQNNDETRLTISGSRNFKLKLTFDYDYSCVYKGKGQGEVIATSNSTAFEKVYNYTRSKNSGDEKRMVNNIYGSFLTDFKQIEKFSLVIGDYRDDQTVVSLAISAFEKLFAKSDYSSKLTWILSDEANMYYNEEYISTVKFIMSGANSFYNLNFADKNLPIQNNDSIIFSSDAYFYDSTTTDPRSLQSDVSSKVKSKRAQYAFDPNDGSYQILLDQSALNELGEVMTEDGAYGYSLDDYASFSVDSISKYYPDVLNSYSPDTPLIGNVDFANVKVLAKSGNLDVSFTAKFSFSTRLPRQVFSFDATLQFYLEPRITESGLNFVSDSGVTCNGLIIPSTYQGVRIVPVQNLITEKFTTIFRTNPYKLFTSDFNLKDYYFSKVNRAAVIENVGFLIGGDFVGPNLTKRLREDLKKALKFLN